MLRQKDILYHAMVIITVVIWGTTFVSTKILINIGMSPAEIMLYRFVLAYFCMLPFAYKKRWANSFKDEFLMLLAGISGGSLYFVAENTALGITLASNVSLLVCTIPIITSVISYLLYKESLQKRFLFGSLVALTGRRAILRSSQNGQLHICCATGNASDLCCFFVGDIDLGFIGRCAGYYRWGVYCRESKNDKG